MAHVQDSSPARTLSTSGEAEQASPVASSCARCFHCVCTVCGLRLHDVPTVTCSVCGSQTHITCARDVYSHEWLLAEVVGAAGVTAGGGAATAASGNVNTGVVAAAASTAAAVAAASPCPGALRCGASSASAVMMAPPSPPSPCGTSSPSTSRDPSCNNLSPSASQALSSAAARIDKKYNYYCHPDCAMGMEVLRNPQFNATLSARIEAAFADDWRRTLQMVERQMGRCESANGVKKEGKSTKTATTAAGKNISAPPPANADVFAQLSASAGGDAAVAHELSRLYSQLRAEAWADYFEQELHHSGHPLFYPPPFVDVQRDAAVPHVLEAAAPQGQAARLFLLDPATHPVGCAVAIPVGVLSRWQQPAVAPLIKVNDSNNFVAEAALVVANGAVVPQTVTVYRSCATEGRATTT